MATQPDGPDRPLLQPASPKPGTYFISHAYRDGAHRDRLIEALPGGVEPFVFPRLDAAPDRQVSQEVTEAIRRCDGLIYLQGGHSAASAWVGFERDYALRIGVPVLAFDLERRMLEPDGGAPLRLGVEPHFAEPDRGRAEALLARLERERSIGWEEGEAPDGYRTPLVFWSSAAAQSPALDGGLRDRLQIDGSLPIIMRLDGASPPGWLARRSAGIIPLREDPSSRAEIDRFVVMLYWVAAGEGPGEDSPGPSK